MADNYLEKQYYEYLAAKEAKEKARKLAYQKEMKEYRQKLAKQKASQLTPDTEE